LTDNGSEFTDRFAGDRTGFPSGRHKFDQLCKTYDIKHRLTRPFSPQTNGMVERFNRRISEAINARPKTPLGPDKQRFSSVAERDLFLLNFVKNYNNTRLCSLKFKSPNEILSNLTKLYT
jgi:transposase InsO family protein